MNLISCVCTKIMEAKYNYSMVFIRSDIVRESLFEMREFGLWYVYYSTTEREELDYRRDERGEE